MLGMCKMLAVPLPATSGVLRLLLYPRATSPSGFEELYKPVCMSGGEYALIPREGL